MTLSGDPAGDFILLGRITKPHGIRGEVKIYPYSGQPQNFLQYGRIYIGPEEEGDRVPYTVEQARVQGKNILLKISGCGSRNDAEALAGQSVWLMRSDLPAPGADEFYLMDLEGKRIITEDGRELGRVTGILETGAHDILSLTGTGREYLIPLCEEFIVRMDEQEVVLKLPPGLLEMNES